MELPLLQLLLVLIVAWLAGRVATRFGFPSVLGELAAGILLGPPILGLLSTSPALDVLAQLGIILMMLYIGMEIDPAEMKKASVGGFLAAIGGFITPFILCYLVIVGLGGTPLAGVFVGMAAGVTSLATKSRILADLRLLDTRIAHVMMAGALIADTLSLIIFAGIVGLAEAGSFQMDAIGVALGKAALFFAAAFFVGLRVIPWIGQKMAATGRGQAFTAVILIGLVYAEAAHLAGMHGILGAFLAGLFLRDSVIGRTLKSEVMGLVKDASVGFLAPIFFVTAGFAVSLDVIWREPGLLLAVIGLATLGKVVGTALFYLPTGHGWREGMVLGAAMNGRGAVEIIIAQIGLTMGLITQDIFSVLVFMAIATTATVPVFLKLGSDWLRRRGELARTTEDRSGTLIIGAGPLARAVASAMPNTTLVDRNTAHCEAAKEAGLRVVTGDALDERVLAEAGAAASKAIITLTGNPEVDALCAKLARDTFLIPEIYLPSYSSEGGHADTVRHLGARSLFAGGVSLTEWDYRIGRGTTEVILEDVETKVEADVLIRSLNKAGPMLVLAVEEDGTKAPFHSRGGVRAGMKLTLLRDTATRSTGALSALFAAAPVLDISASIDLAGFLEAAAPTLAPIVGETPESLSDWITEREHLSSTILESGIAIPHVRLTGEGKAAILLARSREGVLFPGESDPVHAVFLLATSDDRRGDHLRILAAIARMVSANSFLPAWLSAADSNGIRDLVQKRLTMLESSGTTPTS